MTIGAALAIAGLLLVIYALPQQESSIGFFLLIFGAALVVAGVWLVVEKPPTSV